MQRSDAADVLSLAQLLRNMQFIEQFAESVCDYTQKYNNLEIVSYAPENLSGKPCRYPNYGDFAQTYTLRSYGTWWHDSEAYQQEYMPQDEADDGVDSEDFVIVKFEQEVIPSGVFIYETYNPGAVVRIWGKSRLAGSRWSMLWSGPPQMRGPNSHRFAPQLGITRNLVSLLRIDLNQRHLNYHTALDAVLLAGFVPKTRLQKVMAMFNLTEKPPTECEGDNVEVSKDNDLAVEGNGEIVRFALPLEIHVKILGYLDLRSLCRCAQVSRSFREATNVPLLYQNISFKRYWNLVDNTVLKSFTEKCLVLKKLDLSWCGFEDLITPQTFIQFLHNCGQNLTHLALNKCPFLSPKAMESICHCTELIELRLQHCSTSLYGFMLLSSLTNLQCLDLYFANITNPVLEAILKKTPELLHLNIDLCEEIYDMDSIASTLVESNPKLRTLSCWKTRSLTAAGVRLLAQLTGLRELDVGWCLTQNDPEDSLDHVAKNCADLRRLIMPGWRGLMDQHLLPIIHHCRRLRQLDLLGNINITPVICEVALASLKDLRLLDISFCELIKKDQVISWRMQYPHVTIQRSCEHYS